MLAHEPDPFPKPFLLGKKLFGTLVQGISQCLRGSERSEVSEQSIRRLEQDEGKQLRKAQSGAAKIFNAFCCLLFPKSVNTME